MGLEMKEEDMEKLVEDHRKELVKFHNEEAEALMQRITDADKEEEEDKEKNHSIPAENPKEAFSCWNKLSKLMNDHQPDIAAVEMGLYDFNDTRWPTFRGSRNQG
jgi:hypothetical protein